MIVIEEFRAKNISFYGCLSLVADGDDVIAPPAIVFHWIYTIIT